MVNQTDSPRKKKKRRALGSQSFHPDVKSKLTRCFRPNTLVFVFDFVFQISEPKPSFLTLGKTD